MHNTELNRYLLGNIGQRERSRRELERQVAAFGDSSDLDGRQCIIDLMVRSDRRMSRALYDSLVAQGYHVPEAIRPTGVLETEEPEDAPTSPGPASPEETDQPDPTTDGPEMQVVLIVQYESHGPAVMPGQLLTHGKLVAMTDGDGNRLTPPAHSMAELRLELTRQGYAEAYPSWEWLDRGDPPRRRREVWSRHGHGEPETGEHPVPSLWAGPGGAHAPERELSPNQKAALAENAERHANRDPSRPDPWYSQNATVEQAKGWIRF